MSAVEAASNMGETQRGAVGLRVPLSSNATPSDSKNESPTLVRVWGFELRQQDSNL